LRSGTWIRSRRRGLTVRSFAVNGHRNELPRFAVCIGPGAQLAIVAGTGFEPVASWL
jgi:hypothetical protein